MWGTMGGSNPGRAGNASFQARGVRSAILVVLVCACGSPNTYNPTDTFQKEYWNTEILRCFLANDCADKRVSSPVFTPAGSTYTVVQSVSLSAQPSGSIICYLAGGDVPSCNAAKTSCSSGILFTAAITVAGPLFLQAVGCRDRYTDSSPSAGRFVVDATPPTVPTATIATAVSANGIELTWSASSDNITPAGSLVYEVCSSTAVGGCNTFATTATTGPGELLYNSAGLAATTPYYYRIRSRDGAGHVSAPSIEFSATTQASGSVNAPAFSPSGGSYNASQNVTMSTSTGGAIICFTTNGAAPACDTPKTGCAVGTLYSAAQSVPTTQTLRALACLFTFTDSNINSASYAVDTVPPSIPGGPIATAGIGQIALNWSGSTDDQTAGPAIVYEICQSTNASGCNTFTVIYTTPPGAAGYTATSLSPLTTYYYRIRARDSVGNVSGPSAQVSATVLL